MTPLEKAKAEEGHVNYCDECEQFEIVGNAAYCKVDGKLIHPIMLVRGQGTGPAWNCKKRIKPITNYERLIRKTPEEMAEKIGESIDCEVCKTMHNSESGECPSRQHQSCVDFWLEWLKTEV